MSAQVIISHCYIPRGVVAGWVQTDKGTTHRVGHLAFLGWFCNCKRTTSCPMIDKLKAFVPASAIEAAAVAVKAGTAPAGACEPKWPVPRDAPRANRETDELEDDDLAFDLAWEEADALNRMRHHHHDAAGMRPCPEGEL